MKINFQTVYEKIEEQIKFRDGEWDINESPVTISLYQEHHLLSPGLNILSFELDYRFEEHASNEYVFKTIVA